MAGTSAKWCGGNLKGQTLDGQERGEPTREESKGANEQTVRRYSTLAKCLHKESILSVAFCPP